MSIKNFIQFMNEAEMAPAPAPPAAQAPPADFGAVQAPPPAQPAVQPAPAQPAAQSGTTETQTTQPAPQGQGEPKPGDLSTYDNPSATKFSETVKKMVDLVKDLDKDQLIELRALLAKFKGMDDPKGEIGKL